MPKPNIKNSRETIRIFAHPEDCVTGTLQISANLPARNFLSSCLAGARKHTSNTVAIVSIAICVPKFRKNSIDLRYRGRYFLQTPRKVFIQGTTRDHTPSTVLTCTVPRAYSFAE